MGTQDTVPGLQIPSTGEGAPASGWQQSSLSPALPTDWGRGTEDASGWNFIMWLHTPAELLGFSGEGTWSPSLDHSGQKSSFPSLSIHLKRAEFGVCSSTQVQLRVKSSHPKNQIFFFCIINIPRYPHFNPNFQPQNAGFSTLATCGI